MANYLDYLIETNKFQNMEQSAIFDGMVKDYQGTCHSLSEDDFDWLDKHGYLVAWDAEIFNCIQCGWWCADGEQSPNEHEEPMCDECDPEVEDD